MFQLWNNSKPRTKISEYNGNNINTIDDNFTTWSLKNTKQGWGQGRFPSSCSTHNANLSSIEQSYIRNWENDDKDNENTIRTFRNFLTSGFLGQFSSSFLLFFSLFFPPFFARLFDPLSQMGWDGLTVKKAFEPLSSRFTFSPYGMWDLRFTVLAILRPTVYFFPLCFNWKK